MLKGSGAAGVATVGGASVEVAQEVLAETHGEILPLVPYFDTLRSRFIAVALAGIAFAIYAAGRLAAGGAVDGLAHSWHFRQSVDARRAAIYAAYAADPDCCKLDPATVPRLPGISLDTAGGKMRPIIRSAVLRALFCPILAICLGIDARAQESFEVEPTVEIPQNYDSWSLFLICNPAWLARNGDEGIQSLFERYRLFGEAIGSKNLAIWFWKEPAVVPSAELTDVSRSSDYCERYHLLPSQSPHVLVTTRHPDADGVGDYFYVSLSGLNAEDSADVLAHLTDQLLVTGLDQPELDASARWQRTLAAAAAVVGSVGSYFNKVSFSFNTAFFKAEIGHSPP